MSLRELSAEECYYFLGIDSSLIIKVSFYYQTTLSASRNRLELGVTNYCYMPKIFLLCSCQLINNIIMTTYWFMSEKISSELNSLIIEPTSNYNKSTSCRMPTDWNTNWLYCMLIHVLQICSVHCNSSKHIFRFTPRLLITSYMYLHKC